MNNKKIIIIVMFAFILLVAIGGIAYYLIYKSVTDRENFNGKTENLGSEPIDTETIDTNNEERKEMYLKIGDKILTVTLENNSSVNALLEKLEQNDITIGMEDYANFEKVGDLGFSLPRNDKLITTEPGDIILYQGNSITIYYDTNSWNFTKLGKIDNITQKELKEMLGNGNVTVTFTLNK